MFVGIDSGSVLVWLVVSAYLTFSDGDFSNFRSNDRILKTVIFLLPCRENTSSLHRSPTEYLLLCLVVVDSSILIACISFLCKTFGSFFGKLLQLFMSQKF